MNELNGQEQLLNLKRQKGFFQAGDYFPYKVQLIFI